MHRCMVAVSACMTAWANGTNSACLRVSTPLLYRTHPFWHWNEFGSLLADGISVWGPVCLLSALSADIKNKFAFECCSMGNVVEFHKRRTEAEKHGYTKADEDHTRSRDTRIRVIT